MSSALQTAGGLALVLALIFGAAWLLRGAQRFGRRTQGVLRIVASQAVGTRERVVVIALADTWLVLGVAPGQVSRLARLPCPVPACPAPAPAAPDHALAERATSSRTTSTPAATAPAGLRFQTWLERALHHPRSPP